MQALQFTEDGLLPAGDVVMTFAELRESTLVHGPGPASPTWDAAWRRTLVDNLEIMVHQLWTVGITEVLADGPFASGRLERELNGVDSHKVWTWSPASRRPYRRYPKRQLPMWHVYRVELYPHYGQLCGIVDAFGNELEFPSAFRLSRRDGKPRGIIKLLAGGTP